MDSHRARHAVFWIATFAILWGLLLPTLAPAAHSAPGKTWVDVCLAAGVTQVRLDMPETGEARKRESAGDRPDCVPQADILAIAPGPAHRVCLDFGPCPFQIPPILTAPAPQATWSAHPSRAPPHQS